MPSVDIYAASCYDIIILNTGQYQSQAAADYILRYIKAHITLPIEDVQQCSAYQGIAICLTGFLANPEQMKKQLQKLLEEALQSIE